MSDAPRPQALMVKAARALASARLLLQNKDGDGACNRAYYAMFDAAHAALVSRPGYDLADAIKTHRGLISAFGLRLVQVDQFDAELGRSSNKVHRLRQLADYTGDAVSVADAAWAVEAADRFVATIEARLAAKS